MSMKKIEVVKQYTCPICQNRPWGPAKMLGVEHYCMCEIGYWVWDGDTWLWKKDRT